MKQLKAFAGIAAMFFFPFQTVFLKDTTWWKVKENAGATAGVRFTGTLDDQDVVFKCNGVQSGWLNNSLSSTSFGVNF